MFKMLSQLSDFRVSTAKGNLEVHTLEECERFIIDGKKAGYKAEQVMAEYTCSNVERMTQTDIADKELKDLKRDHEANMLVHKFQADENRQMLDQIDQYLEVFVSGDSVAKAEAKKKLVAANCNWTIQIPEDL